MGMWGEYIPVSVRQAQAKKEMEKLKKKGIKIEPVEINGRHIAQKFWGLKWCEHLETFADYNNRLSRGRTYVKNGSVCHLSIQNGLFEAYVSGSSLYKVTINIKALADSKWAAIKNRCNGHIGSLLELLQGKVSQQVMEVVADHKAGLFPTQNEISFKCSCPDWADMCKHVAAVLYAVGNRLDHQPDLLFVLRGVDAGELVNTQLTVDTNVKTDLIESEDLGDLFGIDIETTSEKMTSQDFIKTKKLKEDKTKISSLSAPKTKIKKSSKKIDLDSLSGSKLSQFRVEIGLTVAALADVLGVTSATIYRWENSDVLNIQSRSKKALEELLGKF